MNDHLRKPAFPLPRLRGRREGPPTARKCPSPILPPQAGEGKKWDGHLESAPKTTYAAFCLALIRLRLIRHSAIWTALRAAPLRRLSDTHHSVIPFSTVGSSRTRLI